MKQLQDAIIFGNSTIQFAIRRSTDRATVAVTVKPTGLVSVTAPAGIRHQDILAAVSRKAAWIVRQKEMFRRQAGSQPKQFVSGESFSYLGRQFKLKVRRRSIHPSAVQMIRGELVVTVPKDVDRTHIAREVRRNLTEWYRQKAKDRLVVLAEQFATKLGIGISSVQIRAMPKRWGSGGKHDRINFNWKIIMAPRRLVEYVVAHEICHLRHPNHSRDFWRLLERAMPNYEQRRQELAIRGPRFDF